MKGIVKSVLIYLIGSLKNKKVPILANKLRELGYDVFDDWYSAGYEADDKWQEYEKEKGHNYKQALNGYHADHVFKLDYFHINRADIVILYLPAGKSGHLELGYAIGKGKKAYILMEGEPDRWDVMYRFADKVCLNFDELKEEL